MHRPAPFLPVRCRRRSPPLLLALVGVLGWIAGGAGPCLAEDGGRGGYVSIPPPPPPPLPASEADTASVGPALAVTEAPSDEDLERTVRQVAAPSPAPRPCWVVRAALSAALGQGNSEFLDLKVDVGVKRRAAPWLWEADATYVFGERDGDRSADNWRAGARVERRLLDCAYAFLKVRYERDDLADLDYRVAPLLGIGCTLVDTARDTLKGEGGGGVGFERRRGRRSMTDPIAYVGIDYEHRWSRGKRFTLAVDARPNLGDFDLSLVTAEAHLLAPLGEVLSVDLGLRADYVIDPGPGIENLDLLLTAGLRVEF